MVTNDYTQLPDSTRVWIYQSNRPFTEEEASAIRSYLQAFVTGWVSHDNQLKAYGDVWHNTFVVLMVDESQAPASGCSIDKSVHFLKELQSRFSVDLFDRMNFAVKRGEEVYTVDRDTFQKMYQRGELTDESLVYDTLVRTKGELESQWVRPLGQSWHKNLV